MAKFKFAVGSNMPGYMPDSAPHHATWAECKACLIGDIERDYDDCDESETEALEDYRAAILDAKMLQPNQEFGWTVNNRHYWLSRI